MTKTISSKRNARRQNGILRGLPNSWEKKRSEKQRKKGKNAEFQGIARRDKKAFLSEQSKEIEENNRMGKTRDVFKEIGDIKGIFMQRWAQ